MKIELHGGPYDGQEVHTPGECDRIKLPVQVDAVVFHADYDTAPITVLYRFAEYVRDKSGRHTFREYLNL